MPRRTSSSPGSPAPAAAAPLQWAADVGRQQMAVAAEAVAAVWTGLQSMRSIHEESLKAASQRHADASRELGRQVTPNDWLALQAELLRGDFEAAAKYWQQMAGAALEMNTELLGCGTRLVDTEDAFAPFSARFLHS